MASGSYGNQEGCYGASGVGNPNNGCSGPANAVAADNSVSLSGLKHNPGISVEWSAEEQMILEEGLVKYANSSNIALYAKIAMQLHDKTVRDVALRCRWMSKKESGKRRKDDHMARKNKDKKVMEHSARPSTHATGRPNVPSYASPMDDDDGISYNDIGGIAGQLLGQNAQAFNQIVANLTALKLQENISLFCQTHDNLIKILNELTDEPEVMKHMPPLPEKINEALANSILPMQS